MSKQKPNILFIMADQLTPFMLRAYGDKTCRTPNLDEIAARGVVFDNAYSPCPLCSPARAALMAGKMASRVDCYDNASVLSSAEPTMAHYLTLAGYETVLSGKMHLIGPDQQHGFEKRLNTDIYPANLSWIPFERDEKLLGGGEHAKLYTSDNMGLRDWSVGLQYDEETLFCAQNYLRARRLEKLEYGRDPRRPFFLCVSFHHPHEPFYVTREMWEEYRDEPVDIPDFPEDMPVSAMDEWLNNQYHRTDKYPVTDPENLRKMRRCYYALVTYIDRKVGTLIDELKRCGEYDNTAIVFTSDHGDMLGERGMVQKRCFYEWAARVPLILALPSGERAGERDSRPATLLDLLPTFADIAGLERPLEGAEGASLVRPAEPGRVAFSEYHSEGVRTACFMVRDEKYKLVYIHGFDGQLFDLEKDPREMRNLWDNPDYAAIREAMIRRLLSQFDPQDIAAGIQADRAKRRVVRQADELSGKKHDYCYVTDGTALYYRDFTTVPDVAPDKGEG